MPNTSVDEIIPHDPEQARNLRIVDGWLAVDDSKVAWANRSERLRLQDVGCLMKDRYDCYCRSIDTRLQLRRAVELKKWRYFLSPTRTESGGSGCSFTGKKGQNGSQLSNR